MRTSRLLFTQDQTVLLTRVIDWRVGAGTEVTRPAIAYTASLTYTGLNAFFIIRTHSQLGPRFADLLLYPLALSAKKSSCFGDRKL